MTELIEHPESDWEDWRHEVASGDTRLGIDAWVVHRNEANGVYDDGPAPPLITLDRALVLSLVEPLRLAYIYVLKDSHPEELADDFKPWKWTDEIGFAERCSERCRALLDAMLAERGMEPLSEIAARRGNQDSSPRS